jgi:hypothetical protein
MVMRTEFNYLFQHLGLDVGQWNLRCIILIITFLYKAAVAMMCLKKVISKRSIVYETYKHGKN